MEEIRTHPIVPWPGGKRRLLKHLLAEVPPHTCYVEAFCGGAALLFAKPPSKAEVLNDINSELVGLYRCVQHHLDELVRQFRWALTSREMFGWLQQQVPSTLTDIQRAARFYYLQKLSFGAKVSGQYFGTSAVSPPRLNLLRIEEDLSQAHLRLTRVTVENLPWENCLQRYDRANTFFFLDPPYWKTEGYGVPFEREHYDRLAHHMRTLRGKVLLTINDHPDMRAVFGEFHAKRHSVKYTIGGNHRSQPSGELIIRNW